MNVDLKPDTVELLEELLDPDIVDYDSVIKAMNDFNVLLTAKVSALSAQLRAAMKLVEAAREVCTPNTYAILELHEAVKAFDEAVRG